jgi:hypothetical protein
LDKTRIKYDTNAVADVMELVNSMINPFDNEYPSLVHLCNGSVASDDVESDTKNMYERGVIAHCSSELYRDKYPFEES